MVPFILDGLNQNGFNRNTPLVATPDVGLTFIASLANPFPGGLVAEANRSLTSLLGQGTGTIIPSNRKNGLLQRWEVSLQRELPGRWLAEATYIGNRGYDLLVGVDANPVPQSTSAIRDQTLINQLDTPVANPFRGVGGFEGTNLFTATQIARRQLLRPFPHFTGITEERYNGSSTYHAGQVRLERRFSKGYTILASYAFSNATDPDYENRFNESDAPHRLVVSGIWELPWGRGRAWGSNWRGVKEALLGGFQLQTIYQFQAGTPLGIGNIFYQGSFSDLDLRVASDTVGGLGTTNVTDNVFATDLRRTGFYLSDSAVQTNGQLDFTQQRNDARINLAGNLRTPPSRASNFRNQPINLIDISLIKNFAFNERVKLQFRAEAINAANRFQFNGPVLNPRDTNFGRVTNTDPIQLPREFQLGLRLVF